MAISHHRPDEIFSDEQIIHYVDVLTDDYDIIDIDLIFRRLFFYMGK